jgi:ATP synthase protein I
VANEKSSDKKAVSAAVAKVSSSLSERISHLEQKHRIADDTPPQATIPQGGMALAGRVSSELVAGLIVGAGSGWVLDRWLDTSPLMLVVMFFLGAVAGTVNVWRAVSGRGMAAGYADDYETRDKKDSSE